MGGINETEVTRMNESSVSQTVTEDEKQLFLRLEKKRQDRIIKKSKLGEAIATFIIGTAIVMLALFILFSEILMGVLCGVILVCAVVACVSALRQRKECEDAKAAADSGWDGYLEYLRASVKKNKPSDKE